MMTFLLIIYIFFLGLWIKSSPIFEVQGLSRPFIFFIFISKIIVGILYGIIHQSYFHGGDTFLYLQESTLIGQTFLTYPEYYIGSILGWEVIPPNAEVFTYPESAVFWKDLGTYMLVHIHAILYPFTLGHYELHIFFISIIGLFASLNFYKIFSKILDLPKTLLIICCFFLPSLTFWTAGLHKDAYVYFALSLLIISLLEFQEKHISTKTTLKLVAAICILALTRYYLLALLFPATIAYFISLRYPNKVSLAYFLTYTASFALAFVVSKLFFGINIFEILANQQASFLAESGSSSIPNSSAFEPSIWGILTAIPIAIVNALGRPFLWETKDFLQLIASLEILCFLTLVVFAFFLRKQPTHAPNLLLHFIVAYAVTNLLLVGLLVSNIGTIVRYRAIALGLLFALLTHILDFYTIGFRKKTQQQHKKTITISPFR